VHIGEAPTTLANLELATGTGIDAGAALLDLPVGQVEGAGARRTDDAAVPLPLLLGGGTALLDAEGGAGLARRYLEAVRGTLALALPFEIGLCWLQLLLTRSKANVASRETSIWFELSGTKKTSHKN